jgi:hypothetical protein
VDDPEVGNVIAAVEKVAARRVERSQFGYTISREERGPTDLRELGARKHREFGARGR